MVDENTHNLTPRQNRAISVILNSRSIVEAAQRLDISRETLHKWFRDVSFKEAYDEQSRETVSLAVESLKLTMDKAVEVLNRLLDNRNPNVRHRAACALLDHGRKFIELQEIESRLSELEQNLKENGR